MNNCETRMKDSTLRLVYDNCLGVAINMNDTFYYSCSDTSTISEGELDDLEPVVEKFGYEAFVAYEAIKRGHDPQIPKNANNPDFIAAKAMICDIINKAEEYGEFFELRRTIEKVKALKPNERKKASKFQSKLEDWFSFFLSR